jgi:hypothetical protein
MAIAELDKGQRAGRVCMQTVCVGCVCN